jgi:hypothetical protein
MTNPIMSRSLKIMTADTRRTRAQWTNMEPKAVVAGSPAQIYYCIDDARADILKLWEKIDQLELATKDD